MAKSRDLALDLGLSDIVKIECDVKKWDQHPFFFMLSPESTQAQRSTYQWMENTRNHHGAALSKIPDYREDTYSSLLREWFRGQPHQHPWGTG